MDSDTAMQGVVISVFSLCAIGTLVSCVRYYLTRSTSLKPSVSMEDLTSVATEDPES
jgi:hypothetical protein